MTLESQVSEWINGDLSAIVIREYLIPVEGKESPFFPPTFAEASGDDGSSYCIDVLNDGTRTCLVDTVGSQANRMEPIFTQKPYNDLIPQIEIKAGGQTVNLCMVGHRLADALLKHSTLNTEIEKVFTAIKTENDYLPLSKLAPTSLVFGLWDSRHTQIKIPRIVSSVIRAYDIDELSRSAQYFPPVNYRTEDLLDISADKKENDARSEKGFNEIPSTNTHGGVIAHGDIRKDVVINLAALRKISTTNDKDNDMLQKYVLGLAMIAASSMKQLDLRQNCLLTRDPDKDSKWSLVFPDGKHEDIDLNHEEILDYAHKIANEFQVGKNIQVEFSLEAAKETIKAKKK